MTKQSKSFGSERPFRDHLVAGHGMGQELRDLRADVEEGFQNNEARASFPHLDWLDISAGALLEDGGDIKLLGRNLLQGQAFDTLTLGTANAAVALACLKPGVSGFRVSVVQGAGALVVTFTGGLLTVTLAAGGSTATAVAAAINALPECVGVLFAVAGGTGADNVVVASGRLAGGMGLYAGNKVWVSGVEVLPKHAAGSWADGAIIVTVPDLTAETPARAAGDIVNIMVSSDGIVSEALSGVLTT